MDNLDELVERIRVRVADPLRAIDSAAWVRPMPMVAPPATLADVDAAEAALGFPLPPLLRRLYTEVGNGGWGPDYGLDSIPTDGAVPDVNDLVGLYQQCTAPERALESPAVQWPRGLVPLIKLGCVAMEVCDFLRPPYPVFKLDGDNWDLELSVEEALVPVAASLADRLEAWLAE
ncbi:MAG: hypothetical protein K0Q72_3716 [Armatimonadetes bacterium]|nr:hypothetical protein [Armatimonadota bacterium]